MALPKVLNPKQAGFTLIELLVVMGMLAILAGVTMFMSMDSYRGYSFRTERDSLVSVLQNARGQSVNNLCMGTCDGGEPHGVHFESGRYIIFQGTTYNSGDSKNQTISSGSAAITVSGPDVVFQQLSGDCISTQCQSGTLTINISDPNRASTVLINSQGQITWN